MGFFTWHYSYGIEFYLKRYLHTLKLIIHSFSLTLLLPTLFAPWKRMVDVEKKSGFSFSRWFQQFSFNFVSRLIGAFVRLALFIAGTVLLFVVLILGALGFVIWLVLPIMSLGVYSMYKKHPKYYVHDLIVKVNSNPDSVIKILFSGEAGEFLLKRTGLEIEDLIENATNKKFTIDELYENLESLMKHLLARGIWSEEFFRGRDLLPEDLITAAMWWDFKQTKVSNIDEIPGFGKPGVGLELLYGYTPTLDKYTTPLEDTESFAHHLIGREEVVSQIERVLSTGNGVILTGLPGVGKKTVILEFAKKAAEGLLGKQMSYRRVLELDYNFIFSETTDLNRKKSQLSQILSEAEAAGNIILVLRDLHRITDASLEGIDLTDVLEGFFTRHELMLIAISTNVDNERFLSQNARIRKYFQVVEVKQPTKEEALKILVEAAYFWESRKELTITVPALRKIIEGSDEYITDTPFPEKAIELLDGIVAYLEQSGKGNVLSVDDVDTILSEKTGISFKKLSGASKEKLQNLEEIIHKRLVNQEIAIELIAKSLRSKTVGVVKSKRPIGSFLMLGPTGVGKTETAKALAEVYFGSDEELIRFDMAEYAGGEGLKRLIGSAENNQPGALTSAIKKKPASLLLLDEIEKAPTEVMNILLALLDEGFITDARGDKINCQHLFVVATSNAGASFIRKAVSGDVPNEDLQKAVVNHVLEKNIFSPEFVNRFDGVVVYSSLSHDHLVKIARLQLDGLAKTLLSKNIYLSYDDSAVEKLASEGFEPEFGARPMRRILEIIIGDIIGKEMLAEKIKSGDRVILTAAEGKNNYIIKKEDKGGDSK